MEIIYIHHDCFLVLLDTCSMVFDFWTDPMPDASGEPRFLELIPRDRPLLVFVSHHHKDHYSRDIFGWKTRFPEIRYILSRDTARFCHHILSPTSVYSGPKPDKSQIVVIRPGESRTMTLPSGKSIYVRAFDSTDTGNSYLITAEGMNIFHAGDLNAWIWKDESTEQEIKEALNAYTRILDSITDTLGPAPRLDVCFFPVDSRIGTDYFTGAAMLLQRIRVDYFFPMHFALGTPAEQLQHTRDAARFDLYAPFDNRTVMAGPFAPYGRLSVPALR